MFKYRAKLSFLFKSLQVDNLLWNFVFLLKVKIANNLKPPKILPFCFFISFIFNINIFYKSDLLADEKATQSLESTLSDTFYEEENEEDQTPQFFSDQYDNFQQETSKSCGINTSDYYQKDSSSYQLDYNIHLSHNLANSLDEILYPDDQTDLSSDPLSPSILDGDFYNCDNSKYFLSQSIPGPYQAGDLAFYWYKPIAQFFSDSELENAPQVFDKQRKKAIIIIHGWLGFSAKMYRQKVRFLHNSKEDIISSSSLIMSKKGMDLSFSFVTGDTSGDDLGMMLQCAPHPDSGVTQKQLSLLEFLSDRSLAGCNNSKAYNVGFIDWSSIAYNRRLKSSEKSVWLKKDKHYIPDKDLLLLYKDIIGDLAEDAEITILAHSLGASLALRILDTVSSAANSDDLNPKDFKIKRVILADPYFTNKGLMPFDTSYWPGKKARNALDNAMINLHKLTNHYKNLMSNDNLKQYQFDVAVEIYSTKNDGTELFSDENRDLKYGSSNNSHTLYKELIVESITQDLNFSKRNFFNPVLILLDNLISWQVSLNHRKHLYPLFWILDMKARNKLISMQDVLKIVWSSKGKAWYKQKEGQKTMDPTDDKFAFQLHNH